MAAMTGVGGGRRKKAAPRERPAVEGDSSLALDADGQPVASPKRAGQRQRQRGGGRGLGPAGDDATGPDGVPAETREAVIREAIRRERVPSARKDGGGGGRAVVVAGADAASAAAAPHGGSPAQPSPDGASGGGKPGGKAGGGKPQRRGAAAITFVTCPVCSANFYSAVVLRQHVRDEHPGADVQIDDVPRGPAKPQLQPQQPLPALVTSQSWADMDDN